MYYSPRFSPDGRRLAVAIDSGKGMDIVVHDVERDTTSPITFNAATNADPVWTPDSAHFVFKSLGAKTWHLWWTRADGAGVHSRSSQTRARSEISARAPYHPTLAVSFSRAWIR